jgi:S-adenosylmethionine:tRNA ribosyltransferase-isomerase
VIPARLLGEVGARPAELLLLRELSDGHWEALVRPGRRCRRGARIALAAGAAAATVVDERPDGVRVVQIDAPGGVAAFLERHGLPPLPPYIGRHDAPKPEDRERYQTVYAREGASVAAPTAGLHFTRELMARLAARGIEVHELRLDVGPATFRPIGGGHRTAPVDVDAHVMEPEPSAIPAATAAAIARAKAEGRRVVAVGTTTTRALESAADGQGGVRAGERGAGIFIRPPYRFQVVDALVTNFHLPRSTLLVLVSALAGRELVLAAYAHAVAAGYRFYSFGDAMLIE